MEYVHHPHQFQILRCVFNHWEYELIDDDHDHVGKVNANIRKKVGIFYRLRHFVPMHILVLLYKALLQPHLEYGIEAWGNTYESTLKCLFISQKMAVRAITFSAYLTPSKALFRKLQILDIFELHRL